MALFPLFYAGSIGYYQHLLADPNPIFEAKEHFVKQTFRSRIEVQGPNGRHRLSIPTVKNRGNRAIDQREVSYAENWQKDHWKGLETAYRRSPYFEFYDYLFQPFYEKETKRLFDLNLAMHDTILQILGIEKNYTVTHLYESAPSVKDYRNASFDLIIEKPYLQVFTDRYPFDPNLSILDALFNLGPRTIDILK